MTTRDERRRARIAEQRRARRKQRRTKRTIPVSLVLGALVLAAAGGVAWAVLRSDRPDEPERGASITRDGSEEVPGEAGRLELERTPASYRIVYRLEERTAGDVALSTDKVWVRRPFESRLETWRGAPSGDEKVTTQIGRFALRRNESATAEAVVIGVPPSSAPSDVRLLPVLADAEAAGLLERREVRIVLDRPCQVFRSGQLLSASRLTKATAGEYADSCIDAAGLVLEEVLVLDGAIVSRRIATTVEEDPALEDALFETGARTIDVREGGGLVRRMGEGLPPGEFLLYDPASIPAGFERLGRFNVIPSQPENFTDPSRAGLQETSFADVFVRGADFLVIDQGGTLQGADPFTEDPDAPRIDLGPFGSGELPLSTLGAEVRVRRSGGRFLRLRGTLDARAMAAVAARLTPTEGTGPLEFLEEPS